MVISERQEAELRRLDAGATRTGVVDPSRSLDALLEAEAARRGLPDPVSGAIHGLALLQGSLLKNEYDLSTHAHHAWWEVGAVVVDLVQTIGINMRHGFPVGDAALRAVATALKARFPTAKVVRIHTDAFAVLLPPSAELEVSTSLRDGLDAQLASAVAAVLPEDGEPKLQPRFTIALLRLKLRAPSHWQVLGPIVWAECERALVDEKRSAPGLQERSIALDALTR